MHHICITQHSGYLIGRLLRNNSRSYTFGDPIHMFPVSSFTVQESCCNLNADLLMIPVFFQVSHIMKPGRNFHYIHFLFIQGFMSADKLRIFYNPECVVDIMIDKAIWPIPG